MAVHGFLLTGLGPMFPYLSEAEKRLETEYSFLFLCRAAGCVVGTFFVKVIERYLNFHQCLSIGIGLPGVSLLLFSSTHNLNLKGLIIFISSFGCAQINLFTNLGTIFCFRGQNIASWLQSLHGAFGIGGLIGPFLVYLF